MRCTPLLLLSLLAACGGSDEDARTATADLTGLYVGQSEDGQRDRLCMRTAPSGAVWFGIVAMGPDRAACSGLGRVGREGDLLRLAMAGDAECALSATMKGTKLHFSARVPESCAYYCSPTATLAGRSFEKTGDTAESALEAKDLVGNPLCG